ncbi:hypothetical protein [[Leptolyngbya] sp. PCC 7376]|uniref:hypothetical protein n=1 Tax=[Leptolyngbya] sp. PCC 7376 TaxID=111781 RepID=UPI0002D554D2|nr:hypothetical protein [[Leptolyngbya] sp. PCC 7376]
MNKHLWCATLAGCLSVAIAPIADAAPAKIWTTWEQTNLSQKRCLSRAKNVIRDLGYDYQTLTSGVYGEYDDYSVTIRCITDMNMVFFIATHPNTDWASEELINLVDAF